jgi:hypothetical protein
MLESRSPGNHDQVLKPKATLTVIYFYAYFVSVVLRFFFNVES